MSTLRKSIMNHIGS